MLSCTNTPFSSCVLVPRNINKPTPPALPFVKAAAQTLDPPRQGSSQSWILQFHARVQATRPPAAYNNSIAPLPPPSSHNRTLNYLYDANEVTPLASAPCPWRTDSIRRRQQKPASWTRALCTTRRGVEKKTGTANGQADESRVNNTEKMRQHRRQKTYTMNRRVVAATAI